MNQIFGFKQTITQTWDSSGRRLPITVVSLPPLQVTQVKHQVPDGYEAIQVGFGRKPRRLKEIRLPAPATQTLGDLINATEILKEGDLCAVRGTTKGQGFTGVMKRHGFKGGPKTHGQSDRARAPGSIGQGTSPGRVHKGKKMAGHAGNTVKWLKNIQVVKVNPEDQTVWLKGPLPGFRGALVTLEVLRPFKEKV